MRSTASKILITALATARQELAAPSDPPAVGSESDLSIQLHQSAVNNSLVSMLGGIKIDSSRLIKMLEKRDIPVPDELRRQAEAEARFRRGDVTESADEEVEEPWSLTFDTLQPATVTFSDGKAKIAIRGRKFQQGDQDINERLEIAATYRLRKSPTDALEARRIGEIDIRFVDSPGRLSTRQLAYKTFVKRKVSPLFQPTFSVEDLPEGEISDQLRSLKLDHVEATRGWLAIALGLENLDLNTGSNDSAR